MGALRLDSARPFDAKIEIHCAKYFKISVATPRPLKFSFSTNSRKLAEQKNPQPVEQQTSSTEHVLNADALSLRTLRLSLSPFKRR
jgi:hypothetical protein